MTPNKPNTPPMPDTTNTAGSVEEFEKRQHEMLKGIDDYRKFKGSDDEIERTVAWINQLSPWNLEEGIEHLRFLIATHTDRQVELAEARGKSEFAREIQRKVDLEFAAGGRYPGHLIQPWEDVVRPMVNKAVALHKEESSRG